MFTLADALFGKTKKAVLGILYSKPGVGVHLRELARMADVSAPMMKRELETLVSAGIITSTKDGNRISFKSNENCPVYDELRGIARKTMGITDVFKKAFESADIKLAFIFGSIAKGGDRPDSDIDLMVVSNLDAYAMGLLTDPIEEMLRRSLHVTHYKEDEWCEVKKDKVVISIIKGGKIMVKGNIAE